MEDVYIVDGEFGLRGLERTRFRFGRDYTVFVPFGYATYSPWFEDWFQAIFLKVKERTIVTEDRCYILHRLAWHGAHVDGEFAECGVYRGGTAHVIAHALGQAPNVGKRFHLFDTFKGLPALADKDPTGHKSGEFGDVSLGEVKDYLRGFPFVVYHPGVIPSTFQEVKDESFAFVHVDIDLLQSAQDCCSFFYDRVTPGGVMIFDNYGFMRYKVGEKRAVDEFFRDKKELPISLPTGQCLVFKLP